MGGKRGAASKKKASEGGSTPRPTLGFLSLLRNRGCSRRRPPWRPRSAGSAPLPPRRARLCQPRRRLRPEGRPAHSGQPGDPSRTKRARRRRALSSRGSLRRGVRGRRRPDTPQTPIPAGRIRPLGVGVSRRPPALLGRPGTPDGAPEASVPAEICRALPSECGWWDGCARRRRDLTWESPAVMEAQKR